MMTERQLSLFDFVKKWHGDQKRKYSGAPYYTHLLRVAETVRSYSTENMEVEIALCHDLIEDTPCTFSILENKLRELGYGEKEAGTVVKGVADLTDQFTHEDYPKLNRKARKVLEAKRLLAISDFSQTVKYADIIDNTESIIENDRGFAKVYLTEINQYIWQTDGGNTALYRRCCEILETAMKELRIKPERSEK